MHPARGEPGRNGYHRPLKSSISSWLSRQIAYLNLCDNETCLAQRDSHEALDREIVPFEQIADERSADVLTHLAGDRRSVSLIATTFPPILLRRHVNGHRPFNWDERATKFVSRPVCRTLAVAAERHFNRQIVGWLGWWQRHRRIDISGARR